MPGISSWAVTFALDASSIGALSTGQTISIRLASRSVGSSITFSSTISGSPPIR